MAAETVLRNMQGSGSVQDEHPQPLFQGGAQIYPRHLRPLRQPTRLVHSIWLQNTRAPVVHARADRRRLRSFFEGCAGLLFSRGLGTKEMASLSWFQPVHALAQTVAIRIWAQPSSHRLAADRLAKYTFRGDLYMTADACTHIPASMAEGWVYTHTACSTWPCRSLYPSSLFCRELRPRMADLSWQLTDLARSGLAVTQACHRRGPELSRWCPVDHPILWAVYLRSLPVCVQGVKSLRRLPASQPATADKVAAVSLFD